MSPDRYGTSDALSDRRLHWPRGVEPQDSLRHTDCRAGRRGRGYGRIVVAARPRRKPQTSPRHHAHLYRRARGRWRNCRPSGAIARLAGVATKEQARGHEPGIRCAHPRAASSQNNSLGLALPHCAHRRLEPLVARLDKQTTACARSSPSIRAGMRGSFVFMPSRCCGRSCCWR